MSNQRSTSATALMARTDNWSFVLPMLAGALIMLSPAASAVTYEVYVWGPGRDEIVEGPNNGQEWSGTYNGHTGTFSTFDVTHTWLDWIWYPWGSWTGTEPAGPWREWDTRELTISTHVTGQNFYWYEPGHEGDGAYGHLEIVAGVGSVTKTYETHALYFGNPPVPDAVSTGLLLAGILGAGIGFLKLRGRGLLLNVN